MTSRELSKASDIRASCLLIALDKRLFFWIHPSEYLV